MSFSSHQKEAKGRDLPVPLGKAKCICRENTRNNRRNNVFILLSHINSFLNIIEEEDITIGKHTSMKIKSLEKFMLLP